MIENIYIVAREGYWYESVDDVTRVLGISREGKKVSLWALRRYGKTTIRSTTHLTGVAGNPESRRRK